MMIFYLNRRNKRLKCQKKQLHQIYQCQLLKLNNPIELLYEVKANE